MSTNEAGGKHYGDRLQPWDLQRSMPSWGSVFVDARRTDVIEYMFRKKGDKAKQLDDALKALHNIKVIIIELEKEEEQLRLTFEATPVSQCAIAHTLENAKFINYDAGICMVCGSDWPENQIPNQFIKTND